MVELLLYLILIHFIGKNTWNEIRKQAIKLFINSNNTSLTINYISKYFEGIEIEDSDYTNNMKISKMIQTKH